MWKSQKDIPARSYLVCENYCIFYLSSDDEELIVRVLYQRQDCLKALFLYN